MTRAGTPPLYLYHRLIQPGESVSLEHSDFEEQQENSGKQDEEEDGKFENDFPRDDTHVQYTHLSRVVFTGRRIESDCDRNRKWAQGA